jgi:hypothetical protein
MSFSAWRARPNRCDQRACPATLRDGGYFKNSGFAPSWYDSATCSALSAMS